MKEEKEERFYESLIKYGLSLKGSPCYDKLKGQIERGDVEKNITEMFIVLLNKTNRLKSKTQTTEIKHAVIGEFAWFMANYIVGRPDRLLRFAEHYIETQPKGVKFINSVKSQEIALKFMLEKSIIDVDSLKDEIETYKIGFPDNKVNLFTERALNKYIENNKPKENLDKNKHEYPVLSEKYDAVKIYNSFFKGYIGLCTFECFKDWFVDKYESEKIKPTLQGRKSRSTGQPTLAIAQIRKFIETITENNNDIKDGYFNNVFENLQLNNIETAKNLTIEIENKLKLCEN